MIHDHTLNQLGGKTNLHPVWQIYKHGMFLYPQCRWRNIHCSRFLEPLLCLCCQTKKYSWFCKPLLFIHVTLQSLQGLTVCSLFLIFWIVRLTLKVHSSYVRTKTCILSPPKEQLFLTQRKDLQCTKSPDAVLAPPSLPRMHQCRLVCPSDWHLSQHAPRQQQLLRKSSEYSVKSSLLC